MVHLVYTLKIAIQQRFFLLKLYVDVAIITTYGDEKTTLPREVLVSISKNAKIYKYIGSIIGKCNN